VSDDTLRTLLANMRLAEMQSSTRNDVHDGVDSYTFEELVLQFTMPTSDELPPSGQPTRVSSTRGRA
jgi:hypothetical protein